MKKTVTFFLIFIPLFVFEQEVITFKLIAGRHNLFDCPVFVDLSEKNIQTEKNLSLFGITGQEIKPIDFQVSNDKKGIWFVIPGI